MIMEYVYFTLISILSLYVIRREYRANKELKSKLKRYEEE